MEFLRIWKTKKSKIYVRTGKTIDWRIVPRLGNLQILKREFEKQNNSTEILWLPSHNAIVHSFIYFLLLTFDRILFKL